jgi:hypothetical protein
LSLRRGTALWKAATRPVKTMTWRQVGTAQLRRNEAWDCSWRSLFSWRLNEPSTESQSIPRNVKLVVGMMLDFFQLMRNPASIRIERARWRLARQMWNEVPRTKMLSR